MENVTVFFCDIYGTFDSGSNLNVDCNQLLRFINNLENLRKIHGSDRIIFSFITTEDIDVVRSMENKLRENIDFQNIYLGSHFCSDSNNSKVDKPLEILKCIEFLEEYYTINQVYYADDCEFYHSVLQDLKSNCDIGCDIHSIIPKSQGLANVNEFLEDILRLVDNKQKIKSIH